MQISSNNFAAFAALLSDSIGGKDLSRGKQMIAWDTQSAEHVSEIFLGPHSGNSVTSYWMMKRWTTVLQNRANSCSVKKDKIWL